MAKQAAAEQILQKVKGLRAQMQEGEAPQLALPAIWDNGQQSSSTACDVIVTNQRVMGYYYKSFPREHLFLDPLNLADLKQVTWRDKKYEPVFRELMISDGAHTVYIRTPRQKCQALYDAIKNASQQTAQTEQLEPTMTTTAASHSQDNTASTTQQQQQGVVYGHEEIRRSFESSSLAILVLLIGGILLEIIGIIAWSVTSDASVGIPLIIAGLLAVIVSFIVRRQNQATRVE
ncbi:hypothetical protein ccbrp13_28510 [Ktedonobacteria bacterium brp13]|nr:hypothetical protein ccbrp13_28510 [Ktedonobacteria bacterium brp13]